VLVLVLARAAWPLYNSSDHSPLRHSYLLHEQNIDTVVGAARRSQCASFIVSNASSFFQKKTLMKSYFSD
jgi:hypothetical protein